MFGNEVKQFLFHLRLWRHDFFQFHLRLWQILAIYLTIGVQWHCVELHIGGWYHKVGERLSQEDFQCILVDGLSYCLCGIIET